MKECALKECKITFEVIPRNKKYCSERHKNRATSRRSYDRISNDPARNQKRKDYIRKYMRNRYQTDYEFRKQCISSISKYKTSPKGKATRKRWEERRKLNEKSSNS